MNNTSIRSLLIIQALLLLFSFDLIAQTFNWAQNIGGFRSNAISVDAKGNSYITGYFTDTINFDTVQITSYGFRDIIIVKFDPNGKYIWAKKAGGADYDEGLNITVDAKGNSFVTGYFKDTANFGGIKLIGTAGYSAVFLARYDPEGNCIWAKQNNDSGSVRGLCVSLDANGNSCITGSFEYTATFDAIHLTNYGTYPSTDMFLAKYDPNGNCLWAQHAGGTYNDIGQGISFDENSNCYVIGWFLGNATFGIKQLISYGTNSDIFIAKYDPNGNCLWAKHSGGPNGHVSARSLSVDSKGNCYSVGDIIGSVLFDTYQLNSNGENYPDIFIAKYNSDGNCLWVKGVGGNSFDFGNSISVDKNGSSFVTGLFSSSSVVFDTFNLTSFGSQDIFIAKYDSNGKCLWAKNAGSNDADNGTGISVDGNGSCYITGGCNAVGLFGTIQLAPGTIIAKISDYPLGISDQTIYLPKDYSLSQNYPNPFNPSTVISYSLPSASNVKLIIYNTLGQSITTLENGFKTAGKYSVNFNASDLPSGIYFYKLDAGKFSQVKKMILTK